MAEAEVFERGARREKRMQRLGHDVLPRARSDPVGLQSGGPCGRAALTVVTCDVNPHICAMSRVRRRPKAYWAIVKKFKGYACITTRIWRSSVSQSACGRLCGMAARA